MKDNKSAYNARVYDSHIIDVLPYYQEYHKQVIDLVKATGQEAPAWLDTGCGTGTLALKALETFPEAQLTLCDPSPKMLEEAKDKLQGKDITFFNRSSQQMTFIDTFDVITAIQCHHYLKPHERKDAVGHCYNALKESGLFITFENIKMATDESDAIGLKRWVTFLEEHGNSAEDVKMHINRRGVEVFPITIEEHIALLKECGFRSVNLLWVSYLQAGFWAIK